MDQQKKLSNSRFQILSTKNNRCQTSLDSTMVSDFYLSKLKIMNETRSDIHQGQAPFRAVKQLLTRVIS